MSFKNLFAFMTFVFFYSLSLAQNPILKYNDEGFLYAADPAAEVFDGKVYVYCSHDQADATNSFILEVM